VCVGGPVHSRFGPVQAVPQADPALARGGTWLGHTVLQVAQVPALWGPSAALAPPKRAAVEVESLGSLAG